MKKRRIQVLTELECTECPLWNYEDERCTHIDKDEDSGCWFTSYINPNRTNRIVLRQGVVILI